MKTEIKKIDAVKRQMKIEVSGDIVKNKFEDVFKKIAKDARVPGFRPGHVPRDLLEKHFSDRAERMVLDELLPQLYEEACAAEHLEVVCAPSLSDIRLQRETLSFTATVEVMPQLKLKEYKGIRVSYKKARVAADELRRHLDAIKESHKVDTLDDGFARSLGYPSVAELEGSLERKLYLQKEDEERQKVEKNILGVITKDTDVSLPHSLVKRRLNELVSEAKVQLALKGVPREKIEEEEAELRRQLQARAENDVKVYLIFSEIARHEHIAGDNQMPSRVMEFLLRNAEWSIEE